ncbi:MAG TPA: biosynthetic-type acetolactate synthase large subunit [Ignavibacteriaceae bacterium]
MKDVMEKKSAKIIEKEKSKTETTEKISGAEAVVKCLIEEGVDIVFGYPGGAIMPVYDALFNYQENVKHILTRHEQGAVHAAEGYARSTGKVGVCIATSGPGATNLVTGIADAFIDSTPVVCITGQVASPLLGTDAFQETDVVGIVTPVTKWDIQITDANEIADAFAKAFYIAKSGRPGPVVIDITKDAQFQQIDFNYEKCNKIRSYFPKPKIDLSKVEAAAGLINESKKPFLIFGQGVILGHAENELRSFLEKSGIPSAWTLLGLSALPNDHPQNFGMLGMHGNLAPNKLTNECDVLIAVGMRFDDRVTGDVKRYAKQAKIIHIELDAAEINKIIKADVAVHADAKESLSLLKDLVNYNDYSDWINQFKELQKIEYEKIIKHELYPSENGLKMSEVVRIVSEKTDGEAIVVSDVGQHQMIAARYFNHKNTRSSITSGGLGTMGFCLPAAIGAKLGNPDKQVVAIIGDGGFQMTIQELGTILQTNVAVKVIILNNEFLGMVRQWQQMFFDKRYSQTEMLNPDFIKIASGYGLEAQRVTQRDELESAIDEMLNSEAGYVLEVRVEKEDNVFPMIPTGASVSDIRLE